MGAMTRGRLYLIILVALIVTLGLGYAWGASGRWTVEIALEDSRQQLDLAGARADLLEARVSLYNNNFGDASRRLEDAKAPLRKVKDPELNLNVVDLDGLAAEQPTGETLRVLTFNIWQNMNPRWKISLKTNPSSCSLGARRRFIPTLP